jgi:peptidoglycan/LPS O-acetylase OafA/YrhL
VRAEENALCSAPAGPERPLDPTRYRSFIDGLRAVAVLAVVAHHAHGGYVPGGYVGVDVFFVISGFLIIDQIATALRHERFAFSEFWARRVLRILPAYLLVVLASMALGAIVLITTAEVGHFGDQVVWSAAMAVNHLFLGEQGYFDRAAEAKPLLHLWSLAVEEQFYLLAPIVLAAGWSIVRRGGVRAGRALWLALFAASLAACVAFTGPSDGRNAAFYLMPLRAWELLLGGAIAFATPAFARLPPRVLELLAVLGLAAIGVACFAYTPATAFPSYRALLPVAGAAVALGVGVARPNALAIRALSIDPIVFVGLVSYAFYLWHWPLLTFGRIVHFQQAQPLWDTLLGIALPFALAVLTHRFVERPIKAWRQRRGQPVGWSVVAAGVLSCACVAFAARLQFPQPVALPANLTRCNLFQINQTPSCRLSGDRGVGVLLGDSHASAAYEDLQIEAARAGHPLALAGFDGCGPSLGMTRHADGERRAKCVETHARARDHLLDPDSDISFAIVIAEWAYHTEGLLESATGTVGDDQRALFEQRLRDTLDVLERGGAERILLVSSVPIIQDAPECIPRADRAGVPRDQNCSVPRATFEAQRDDATRWTANVLRDKPQIRVIDPIDDFCDATTCRPTDGDTLLYGERSHLSRAGVQRVIDRHRADLDWVLGAP